MTLPSLGQLQTLFGTAASLVGAAVIIAWRFHETRRPVHTLGIVIPPLGMSTGFAMFIAPEMRIPLWWGVAAFLVGAVVFAIPLARTSRLERDGDAIMMRRSPAFLAILLVLVAIRFALHNYIDRVISPLQTAALFFVLAFGMILRWRLGLLIAYRALTTTVGPGRGGRDGGGPPSQIQ